MNQRPPSTTDPAQRDSSLELIEQELSRMSTVPIDSPDVRPIPSIWRAALESSRGGTVATGRPKAGRMNTIAVVVASIAAVLLLVGILMPALGKARSSSRELRIEAESVSRADASTGVASPMASAASASTSALPPMSITAPPADQARTRESADASRSMPIQRLIVRKATIELAVPDVAVAFAKVQFIVSDAGGEFSEESSLTGNAEAARGTLKLRVRAERLSAVLGELRALGLVASESSAGEDITDQIVDLEARIRNEQRVEAEVLELLSSRKNAPLKDILELRTTLSSIRQSIERMIGQRDRLGGLVSLSSILVVLRHESTFREPSPVVADTSTLGFLAKSLSRAWTSGVKALINSLAWLIELLVGGAVVWCIIGLIVWGVTVAWRRRERSLASEPAPTLDSPNN